jgi:hypothetical protein
MSVSWSAQPRNDVARPPLADDVDFSLVLGGPTYRLFRRAHLADGGDDRALLRRRTAIIAAIAWLPLLLLTAVGGHLVGGVEVPFLQDLEVHTKFLLALPLLVGAELVVHERMRFVAKTFLARELVAPGALDQLKKAIASAYRLRNSVTAELALLVIVYGVGISIVWRGYVSLDSATWYASPGDEGSTLTLAGLWYAYVSLPIFQFLLCRWYFRVAIWARLLWQVSRLELQLMPTHPDRAGGLGFLSNTVYAFVPIVLAHGVLLAGVLASQIFHTGARLTEFRLEILLLVIFLELLVVGPLSVFAGQLANAKRRGLREYGALAHQYVRGFDARWVRREVSDDALLGTADLQSLADLGNSYSVIREMRIVPVSRDAVLQLGLVAVAPIVPLTLTLMPLEQLLTKLIGMLF